MFSALVLVDTDPAPAPEAIVRTLAALVPAAIEGVIRDVALAAPAESAELSRIADHAGCELVTGARPALLRAAAGRLKERRVFVLRAGLVPERGFIGELADLLAYRPDAAAVLRLEPRGFFTRLLPSLSPPGACVTTREALAAASDADASVLARGLSSPAVFKARLIGAS